MDIIPTVVQLLQPCIQFFQLIQEELIVTLILTLGYSAEEKLEEESRREIFDFSFFDKWGEKEADFGSRSFLTKLKGLFKKK